jgi:hypothetical protein
VRHLLARQVRGGVARDEAAVAHHDHLVGDALHLVELVRDVDESHAVGLELRHQREQALRFRWRERRGRLVHDQQPRPAGKRPGDLDQLLLRHDELAHLGVGIGLQPHLAHHRRRAFAHRRVVEPPAAPLLVAEEDVLRDGQVLGQVELLVDQHDAGGLGGARSRELRRAAVDAQLAAGGRLVAGGDLHQRRLARAVLAEQPVDPAGLQRETDPVQHLHRAEGLDHLVERQGDAHRATSCSRRLSCMASTPAPTMPARSPSGVYWISR